MRAAGTTTWHGLATDRQGSLLVAHVDDERFRKGAYEFRAHAVDQAGNEASTGRRADGSAATLRLPARIDTRLAVGVPRTIVRRRVERRNGHRRLVRRRIRRLDSNVIARHGRAIRLSGFLANADGQPIEGATIEALEKTAGRWRCPSWTCNDGDRRQVPLRGEGHTKPRDVVPVWRFEAHWFRDQRFHAPRTRLHHHPPRPTPPPQWTAGALHWTGDHAPASEQRKARRDAGLLPWTVANVLDCPGGQWRSLALPVPVRGHHGASDLPVPRATPGGGWLSVHQRQFARRKGGGTGPVTAV